MVAGHHAAEIYAVGLRHGVMNADLTAKPRMIPIENFLELGSVGVPKPCCTTARGLTRAWDGRCPIRPTSTRCRQSRLRHNQGHNPLSHSPETVQANRASSDLLEMCHPNKRQMVTDLARYYRVHRLEVLENLRWWVKRLSEEDRETFHSFQWDFFGVREFEGPRRYRRKKPRRPVLVPRRQGEERATFRRYPNPDTRVPRVRLEPRPRRAATQAAAE